MTATHHLRESLYPWVLLRVAEEKDMDDIKNLYYTIHGEKYILPEVNNRDKMKWAIHDPNYLWLLLESQGRVVGSLIFLTEKKHRLGKTFAGVVHQDLAGQQLIRETLRRGINYIFYEKELCDIIYGVVRNPAFHQDLKELGFQDGGIFPNVRKFDKYETHTLKVLFRKGSLANRKVPPLLIPPCNTLFTPLRERLGLKPAQIEPFQYHPASWDTEELLVEKSPEIEWEFYRKRDAGELLFTFYPFHYPQYKLHSPDNRREVFLHFDEMDGYCNIMGIRTDQPHQLTRLLNSISHQAETMGVKYLEFLINAYSPRDQINAYNANFLPCAYFPAMKMEKKERMDHIITCRSFVPINFADVTVTQESRPFYRAYYKILTSKMWEDLEQPRT